MDDLNRDKLYASPADGPDSDDSELELEPPDPEVLAAEQLRAAEAIDAHRASIDVNAVYRDLDAHRDSEILSSWTQRLRGFRPSQFQFQVKHLLILTAMVAIVLAFRSAFGVGFGTMLILGVMIAVAGISLVVKLEENRRDEEAARRRRKMYAERRAQQARQSGQVIEEDWDAEPLVSPPDQNAPSPAPLDFRFRFSTSQLFMVITGAALLLGIGTAVGGIASIAPICGLAALAGLIIPALGLRPPEFVVFAWWMLLLVYVVLSLSTAIWTAFSAG
jgi:hypothetical protein